MEASKQEAATRVLFGRNMRRIRRERDISQETVSEAIGASQGHISEIEAGKRNVSIDLIGRIARVIGVPIALLFEDPSDGPTRKR